jgi:hypothetical protein
MGKPWSTVKVEGDDDGKKSKKKTLWLYSIAEGFDLQYVVGHGWSTAEPIREVRRASVQKPNPPPGGRSGTMS